MVDGVPCAAATLLGVLLITVPGPPPGDRAPAGSERDRVPRLGIGVRTLTVPAPAWYADPAARRPAPATFHDLAAVADRVWEQHGTEFVAATGYGPETARAVVAASFVHGMWGMGLPPIRGRPTAHAGVLVGPHIDSAIGTPDRFSGMQRITGTTVAAALQSPYAMCNDYAVWLWLILAAGGTESHLVGYRGHMYVTATLDGQAVVIDPMWNLLAVATNEQYLDPVWRANSRVDLFPMVGDNDLDPRYRRDLAARRLRFLADLSKPRKPRLPLEYRTYVDPVAWLNSRPAWYPWLQRQAPRPRRRRKKSRATSLRG